MLKAVIFDVDGVMLDSEPLFAAGREALAADYGLVPPEGINVNGSGMLEYWQNRLAYNGKPTELAFELSDRNFDYCLDGIVRNKLKETEGLTHLLGSLSDRYTLAVGSSSKRTYVEFVLGYLGVRNFFDIVVCGDEVRHAKPAPDIYLKVKELLGLRAEECVVIEDSDNGMTAAVTANIPCLGMRFADAGQKLDKCKRVFTSMRALEDYLSEYH